KKLGMLPNAIIKSSFRLDKLFNLVDMYRYIRATKTHKRGNDAVMFDIWMCMLMMRMSFRKRYIIRMRLTIVPK
ncbi:MAG: hypothetical protein SCABRO_01454, partial [Candidatus Scalindua brodae]